MVLLARDVLGIDAAIMLVAPYNEVNAIIEHALGYGLLRTVWDPVNRIRMVSVVASGNDNLPILMQYH